MAFCSDREDVVSLALTATMRLVQDYQLDLTSIGRCVRLCLAALPCKPLLTHHNSHAGSRSALKAVRTTARASNRS